MLVGGQERKNRLSEQVAQRLREMIIEKRLAPGAKLATQSELVEQLGVSRTVVREAVKTLEEWRVIRAVTGKGLFVTQMDGVAVSEAFRLLLEQSASPLRHVQEVRRLLETEIAGLAAERATSEDLARLEQTCRRMTEAHTRESRLNGAYEIFIEADDEFHATLAIAAHNPLLTVMLAPIADLLQEAIRVATSAPGAMGVGVEAHWQIYERVKAHDRSGARNKMKEHLMYSENLAAIATSSSPPGETDDNHPHITPP